jgi:DNA-binding transcriptional ArsR family regulator
MKNSEHNQVASVLRAAGHTARVQILELLNQEGSVSVNDICEKLNMEQSLTSHHLSLLAKAGYVKGTRKGKFIFYSIASRELFGFLKVAKMQLGI